MPYVVKSRFKHSGTRFSAGDVVEDGIIEQESLDVLLADGTVEQTEVVETVTDETTDEGAPVTEAPLVQQSPALDSPDETEKTETPEQPLTEDQQNLPPAPVLQPETLTPVVTEEPVPPTPKVKQPTPEQIAQDIADSEGSLNASKIEVTQIS